MKRGLPNLSLFKRSLLFESLRWQNYLLLFLVCVIVLITLGFTHLTGALMAARGAGSATGLQFFSSVVFINTLVLLLASITAFASSITEEKEVNMLGLLMMTGISNVSLLFSKAASKLTLALVLLVVQIPFSVLAVTLGGISLEQIFAVNVALAAWAFFSCNAALFSSVLMPGTGGAALVTACIIIGSLFLYALGLNPFVTISAILRTGYTGGIFGWHVIANLVVGACLFVLSLLVFRNDSTGKVASVVAAPGTTVAKAARSRRVGAFRIGRVWNGAALAWKEFYFSAGGKLALLFCGVCLLGGIVVAFIMGYDSYRFSWSTTGGFMIGTGVVVLLVQGAFVLPSAFGREVKQQTLPALVMLPGRFRTSCYMKLMGVLPLFVPTIAYILLGRILTFEPVEFMELAFWCMGGVNVLFYFHLVVLLSLYVRFGAFALAAVIHWGVLFIINIPMWLITWLIIYIGGTEMMAMLYPAVLTGIFAAGTFILHRWIGRALLKLACQ